MGSQCTIPDHALLISGVRYIHCHCLGHLAAWGTALSSLSGQKRDKIFGIWERCFTINTEMFLQTTGYCLNHISVESFVFKAWPHITRYAFLAFNKGGFFFRYYSQRSNGSITPQASFYMRPQVSISGCQGGSHTC